MAFLCAFRTLMSSAAADTDAVTAFRPLMTDAHTEQQPRRTSTTGATTSHQMHGAQQ
ncbi:hypothetical protein PF005_g20083 [Phytophthora fragariae]|uniref:RxLR effector protein n=1 Tax=Phytophthora fragariae TaxID=53985 RepID=A0A6A3WNY3_9STRA|nr:hypothetical protein PF009_g22005 [Phytophthora fragariae]KAE8986844.1 hypothetical protein PF011_g19831 [Phytophthora fragariae]KAE9084030.1 hypothetical protein PF010_g20997 [Phytophthora fragariae]KAE9084174.1 hypothetical protein PF007_g21618 [Phytophthora fragariae]KAE9112178.1 hypothetical protein PF006_g20039 [Phytophthora fragariae]